MKRTGILTLCALLSLSSSSMAMMAEIGKVVATEGRVDVTRAPDNEAILLAEGASVFIGDSIRAKDHSKAEIVFADKSVIKIAPNTRMEIKDFVIEKGARKNAQINLARGKILADVSKTGTADTFTITTPNARGSVRGTEVVVIYQAERTNALVKDGRLSINNIALPDQKQEITGGEAITVPFNSSPEKPHAYMDSEFALHEQDAKPATFRAVSLGKGSGVMRGAIKALVGGVRVLKKGGSDWHYVKINEFVEEGDKIETAEDGMMSLMLDNGNMIQVQPNSRIMLSMLKRDPKTGEFDNTFELDAGKVKAVVEKLGKGSSFRVKTPTALCGVRGTVMYVNAAPTATQAFYEGGGGVVTNPVSGSTTFVESGQNTISTDTGKISEPAATPTDVKMTLDASYSYGVAGSGYSSPENSATTSTKGGDTIIQNVDSGPNTQTQTSPSNVMIPADLVPITEANRPQPQPGVVIDDVAFSALVGKVDTLAIFSPASPTNTVTGQFTLSRSADSIWTSVGKGEVIGNVASSANIPASYAFWIGDQVKCATANGGQYRGWLGASLSTTTGNTKSTFWGGALCLYKDPYGWAGTMTFDCQGKFVPADNYFYSVLADSGTVNFSQREFVGPDYDLNSQTLDKHTDLHGRGSGYFWSISNGKWGSITCGATGVNTSLSGVVFNLPNKNWGIWQLLAQGTYSGSPYGTSDNWNLALGGERGSSCWLGAIDGNFWDDRDADRTNQFTGRFQGVFLDTSGVPAGKLVGGYILEGDVAGIADPTATPNATWQAIGGGEFYIVYTDFSEASLGFTAAQLATFVNVPISEVAATNMALSSQTLASFTKFNMDARVYQSVGSTPQYIWTGIIDGAFSAAPTGAWTVRLTDSGASVLNLKNGTWSGGSWSAVVDTGASAPERTIGGHLITNGEAAGTYNAADGTLKGIAAGTAN